MCRPTFDMAAWMLCWTLLTAGFLGSAYEENISAHPGDNVTLQSKYQNHVDKESIMLEWSRPDHGKMYVFFYRDGQFNPENQHPSFKNRAELRDKEMKDGDMSLILINVTTNDTGKYECRVLHGTHISQRVRRALLPDPPISVINLEVTNTGQDFGREDQKIISGGQRDGKVQEHVGLMLCQIVFLLFLMF